MNGATRFVILGTQRTGTTYIRTMLDNHPDVRCIGEAFLQSKKGSEYYYTYLSEHKVGFIKRTLGRKTVLADYLNTIYGQDGYKAIGFKLMLNQSGPLLRRYLIQNNVKVIVLVRENVLKTLLSRETAKSRNVYHLKGEQQKFRKISLNCQGLIDRLKRIEEENRKLLGFTSGESLQVKYEQVLGNSGQEFARILGFIGVDENETLSSPLVKINPNGVRDIVSNYEDVERALMGSGYGRYLS